MTPGSWKTVLLGEVCEFARGLTYKKADEVEVSDNAVLRANNIDVDTGELNFDEIRYIHEDITIPERKKLQRNCLLVCTASGSRKHLGKIAHVDDDYDYAFGGFMGMLKPREELLARYLFYISRSDLYTDFIATLSHGVNINNLKWSQLQEFAIPLPPLSEQRRIVSVLDAAFAGLATATANTQKNLQNAQELFEIERDAIYLRISAQHQQASRRLDEVLKIGSSKRIMEKDWTSSGVPFFGGKEIVELAESGEAKSRNFISEEKYAEYAAEYDMPSPGDILLTARGTIGTGYIVQDGDKFYYKDGNIISMRPGREVNSAFVLQAFNTPLIREQLQDLTGTTVKHLPLRKAKQLTLPIPSIGEQESIVNQIDELDGLVDDATERIERKLTALEELKQSILHRAFRGELSGDGTAINNKLMEVARA